MFGWWDSGKDRCGTMWSLLNSGKRREIEEAKGPKGDRKINLYLAVKSKSNNPV